MNMPWLSEEDRSIREIAERFGREKLREGYQRREGDKVLDRGLMREMGALGLMAPTLAEEHGGIGASNVVAGLICEAIAYADFNLSYVNMTSPLIGGVIE